MDRIEALLGNRRPEVVQRLGQQFGLSESQASSALGALLPALAAGFQRNASTPTGLDGLLGALRGGGHQRYLDDLEALGRDDTIQDGNGILGHVFGSKDVSRQVAQRAAAETGVGPDLLKRMLPVVAALVMGALSKRQSVDTADARLGPQAQPGGGLLDMLAPMLDRNRDGSVLDDVLGMIGRATR
jgi:hypothetical protein